MEACRRLSQTARVAALRSGWKFKNTYPLLSACQRKGKFGSEGVVCSNMTSQAKEIPYNLTKEEVFTFLDQSLGIPRLQVYAGGKSLEFLNHVIKGIKTTLPFTSMNLLAGKFHDLTQEDMKYHIISGQGGTCLWINPFTKALLEQLGHTAYHISGNIPVKDGMDNQHIGIIVRDVSYPGSQHLVDPGIRWPLTEAVPLDFKSESPEYTFHKLRTKFFKRENDTLLLCTPSSSTGPENYVVCDSNRENWQIRIAYLLNDKIPWFKLLRKFQQMAKNIVIWDKPFDSLLFFAFSTKKHVSIMCSDGQAHATFYDLENHTTERVTMTKAELMDFFLKHYPQYSVKKLENVFKVSKLI
ncbi:hypothetical protein HOLleu_34478 [Holothuria leucospilota]|uniref:arylamine N-acetyltransferase n=1 Tax=Holothuria leucospilota TaxID=206669 RepID=A0A9Q1BGQ5_HOLLE|nr:hypothetical protein HOLleu_34478 [Holothuria leucospilota]